MIVIDASSLTKFLLKEDRWKTVEPYLRQTPLSLDYILLETGNAIWKEYLIRKQISKAEALQIFQNLKKIKNEVLTFEWFADYLNDGFDIAVAEKISLYDAVYIAQARKRGSLITSDGHQKDVALSMRINTIYLP